MPFSRKSARFIAFLALLGLLALFALIPLAGCGLNTQPIQGDQDSTASAAELPAQYAGCDIDLHCTTGCEEDLDCLLPEGPEFASGDPPPDGGAAGNGPPVEGADAGTSGREDPDGPSPAEPWTGEVVTLAALEQRWIDLGDAYPAALVRGELRSGAPGTAVLAVYEGNQLLSRSLNEPVVWWQHDAPSQLRLRVVATEGPVVIDLSLESLPPTR